MIAPSLRSHIADVMAAQQIARKEQCEALADALLADATFKAIIDLAAWITALSAATSDTFPKLPIKPEMQALLQDWRAERD